MKIERLFDTIVFQAENYPKDDALSCKIDGVWKKYSTQDVLDNANAISLGLLKMGIVPGDRVAIVSFNRPEWVFADLAISQLGAVNVPMYPNSTSEDYQFILEHADVKLVLAGDADIYEKLKSATTNLANPIPLYTFDDVPEALPWTELKQPLDDNDEYNNTLSAYRKEVKPNQLATLIYTSGTTGTPKGVMLSHDNILSNSRAVGDAFPFINSSFRVLSFLPLCHIFERTAIYLYLQKGISTYFAESVDTIAANLKEVSPDFFTTVPRLLEKIYDKILSVGYHLKGIKKLLFFWSMNVAQHYVPHQDQGFFYDLKLKIANALVFKKWREALGGNVKFIISGAAALQPRLATVFWAADIKVLEAYGMTESSPGITFTRAEKERVRVGTVGELLDGVQLKIADDGEILVKGPNVMMGYYNRQDLTDKTIDQGGWLHTGDVGLLLEGKYLKITDRKKEMFKTSGGKYIAPQPLENKFKESLLIEQIMVVGEGKKFPSALIVPSFDHLRQWCQIHHLEYTTDAEMIDNKTVLDKFESELVKYNEAFAQYEKIKKFRLLPELWSIETGELTPTLKLKRKKILEIHHHAVEAIYS